MSASTLLSKTPLPRSLASIYDPQGGATSVTDVAAGAGISVSAPTGSVTIANTGVTSVIAGSGVAVSSATGDVTVSSSVASALISGDIGTLATSGTLQGVTPSDVVFSGGSYAPVTLVPGKIYTVTASFSTNPSAIPNPGGYITASFKLSNGGGAGPTRTLLGIPLTTVAASTGIYSCSATFSSETYTQLDMVVRLSGSVDANTISTVGLTNWGVVAWA